MLEHQDNQWLNDFADFVQARVSAVHQGGFVHGAIAQLLLGCVCLPPEVGCAMHFLCPTACAALRFLMHYMQGGARSYNWAPVNGWLWW